MQFISFGLVIVLGLGAVLSAVITSVLLSLNGKRSDLIVGCLATFAFGLCSIVCYWWHTSVVLSIQGV